MIMGTVYVVTERNSSPPVSDYMHVLPIRARDAGRELLNVYRP